MNKISIIVLDTKMIRFESGKKNKILNEAVFDTDPKRIYCYLRKNINPVVKTEFSKFYGYVAEIRFGGSLPRINVPVYFPNKKFFMILGRLVNESWEDGRIIISKDGRIGALFSRKSAHSSGKP